MPEPRLAPISVDGPRPAVEWVSKLPQGWTTTHERLLLYVLACDAYGSDTAPGSDALVRWTGMVRSRVWQTLRSLLDETSTRPALLEKMDTAGKGPGRNATRYRLRLEVEPSEQGGRLTVPDGRTVAPAQPSSEPSWQPSSEPSDRGGRTLPFPSSGYSSSTDSPERAAAIAEAKRIAADARLNGRRAGRP